MRGTKPCDCCGFQTTGDVTASPLFVCARCVMLYTGETYLDGSAPTATDAEVQKIRAKIDSLRGVS